MRKAIPLVPHQTSPEKQAALIQARVCAQSQLEALDLKANEFTPDVKLRFWDTIARGCKDRGVVLETDTKKPDSMTDDEARRFERQTPPNGIFQEREVIDIPQWYIDGVYASDFARDMQRYLNSDRYQRRLRGES